MASRRSKPMFIAPLIPFWGIVGLFAIEYLHGNRFFPAFVVFWTSLLIALFAYVASRAVQAKRARTGR